MCSTGECSDCKGLDGVGVTDGLGMAVLRSRSVDPATPPAGLCSYWQRQEFRHIDDHGFGMSPFDLMLPEQAEAAVLAREEEDVQDPPCGRCVACLESAAVPEEVEEPETTPIGHEPDAELLARHREEVR